jgi:signal transduction histidine kinase
MRAVSWVFGVVGGCALIATVVGSLAGGNAQQAGWILIGPTPIYAAGLAVAFRGRGHPVAAWLLAGGSLDMVSECLGDVALPRVGLASAGWVVLAAMCTGCASQVAGMGLFGLFPTGRPDRRWQRTVLIAAAVLAVLVPVLVLVSSPRMPRDPYAGPGSPPIASPLFQAAASPLSPVANVTYQLFVLVVAAGLVMLYVRYRRSPAPERRQVRLALVGLAAGTAVFGAQLALAWIGGQGFGWSATVVVLWVIGLSLVLGSLIVALSPEEMLGIDSSAHRSLVNRGLRGLIAIAIVAVAAALGIVASRYMSAGAAILLAAAAVLASRPAQRRLERFADRWAFGARLDGYEVLTRFGVMLETSPGPDDLLARLAGAICQCLLLQWSKVRLDLGPADGRRLVGVAGVGVNDPAVPALAVPLTYAGEALGAIECGPRRDGPLLEEDRRLLVHLVGQAAAAVHNLHLSAQLAARLEVIREQAAELAASRHRIVRAQDAERQRIERNLHDGAQQQLVALSVQLSLLEGAAGDPGEISELTGQLRSGLRAALEDLRALARGIYPPVLADQGLPAALRAQADRAPVPVLVNADGLGRYSRDAEATLYFCILEALQNTAKHAAATLATVTVRQVGAELTFCVTDDGAGFDPAKAAQGTGLQGMADRLSAVGGQLRITSASGHGTTISGTVPVTVPASPPHGGTGQGGPGCARKDPGLAGAGAAPG